MAGTDLVELMKFQMISGGGNAGTAVGGGIMAASSGVGHWLRQVFLMLFLSMVNDLGKVVMELVGKLKDALVGKVKGSVTDAVEAAGVGSAADALTTTAVLANTRHTLNTLEMTRIYEGDGALDESASMVDAVLTQIGRLCNVPTMRLIQKGQVLISYKDRPIQLTREVFAKIHSITMCTDNTTNKVASVRLMLMSNEWSAAELAEYVRTLHANYTLELKNSLGNAIYFFDHKSKSDGVPQAPMSGGAKPNQALAKAMRISTAPKQLSFTMTPFHSNKRFNNIYGQQVRQIEQRVRFFMEHRNVYDAKGIPYQLGLLLSGIHGAGKTSVIRAIANATRRHIINIQFSNITTATQLKNLFYSDKLHVYQDQSMNSVQSYHIPIDQRLYVLEEIDTVGDIVRQRTASNSGTGSSSSEEPINDELTLGEILTVLDGTMEVPGRMLVVTTNHPEVLDRALIRPGRIDVQVHFGCATREVVAEMYEGYMERSLTPALVAALPHEVLTPAEVGQVLFRHFNEGRVDEVIVADIVQMAEAKNKKDNKEDKENAESVLHLLDVVADGADAANAACADAKESLEERSVSPVAMDPLSYADVSASVRQMVRDTSPKATIIKDLQEGGKLRHMDGGAGEEVSAQQAFVQTLEANGLTDFAAAGKELAERSRADQANLPPMYSRLIENAQTCPLTLESAACDAVKPFNVVQLASGGSLDEFYQASSLLAEVPIAVTTNTLDEVFEFQNLCGFGLPRVSTV